MDFAHQAADTSNWGSKREKIQGHSYFSCLLPEINACLLAPNSKQKSIPQTNSRNFTLLFDRLLAVRMKKGTVIYAIGDEANAAYLVISGRAELLRKKTTRQKTIINSSEYFHTLEQRRKYLSDRFGVFSFERESAFFEDEFLFGLMPFATAQANDSFGFRELIHNSSRTKTAVLTQDSLIVTISKAQFHKYLSGFQSKREDYIREKLLHSCPQEVLEDLNSQIDTLLTHSELITLDTSETIFKENEHAEGVYFLLGGECCLEKSLLLEVPEKLAGGKKQMSRSVSLKVSTIIENSFVGDIEVLLGLLKRQYTATTTTTAVILKIQHASFLKIIASLPPYERQLSVNAKFKHLSILDNYGKRSKQAFQLFLNKFQEIQTKKKESVLTTLLPENQVNKEQFELFSKEGLFFRDSFERLEGFDSFISSFNPHRSSIHRQPALIINIASTELKKESILFSPKRLQQEESRKSHRKKRTLSKFQEIIKDEEVYKSVLIKNGLFRTKGEMKSNLKSSLFDHKFENIIKDCVIRRNVQLRKNLSKSNNAVIKQAYRKSVQKIQTRSSSVQTFRTRVYRGSDEMRTQLQKEPQLKMRTRNSSHKKIQGQAVQLCLEITQQPQPTIQSREAIPSFVHRDRVLLLNHMMKPIVYTSVQK